MIRPDSPDSRANSHEEARPLSPDLGVNLDPSLELPSAESPASEALDEVRRLRQENEALQDRLLRVRAEAENVRKRTLREMADLRTHTLAEAVRAFLPVLDGFERAAQHSDANPDEVRKGVELLHRQLIDAAHRIGLEPVPALDLPFDPHVHEAIEMIDNPELPDRTVVQELQRGYTLKDKLIRPAMVKVSKAS